MVPTQSESQRPHAPRHVTLRRERRSDERGAVLVEMVFILPILLLLVFGTIELSLAFQTSAKMSDATRSAGRAAAGSGGRDGFGDAVSQAAAAALGTMPPGAQPLGLAVFEPDPGNGKWPTGVSDPTDAWQMLTACVPVNTPCQAWNWDPATRTFVPADFLGIPSIWNPDTHKVCAPPYGRIGVMVTASYETATGFFGVLLNHSGDPDSYDPIIETAYFTFDPDLTATCTP